MLDKKRRPPRTVSAHTRPTHAALVLCCGVLAALAGRVWAGGGRKLSSWRGPGSLVLGSPPVVRSGHGLAAARGRLYVFGGLGAACGSNCNGEWRGGAVEESWQGCGSKMGLLEFSKG
jgi:hypothetical protein